MGGLLGAGLIWLTSTKKGKEVREQILDYSHDVYEKLEKKLRESGVVGKISQSTFVKRAKEMVDEYSEQKNIPAVLKAVILQTVLSQWDTFQKRMEIPAKEKLKKSLKKKSLN